MAITRREFVTRLGALAAAMGLSQADLAKVTQAFAHDGTVWGTNKPKVIWVHGAECTGCSTSLLGLFEDARGLAVEDKRLTASVDPDYSGVTTVEALGLITSKLGGHALETPHGHRTFSTLGITGAIGEPDNDMVVNIADVVVDFIDLQYHETVMGMGGDLAYQYLADNMYNDPTTPFVMVVEGAVQVSDDAGLWNATGDAPWCSIAMDAIPGQSYGASLNHGELKFDQVVSRLAEKATCAAIISIGQCAAFGGYPACESPVLKEAQTPAYGVYDFLKNHGYTQAAKDAAAKVVNVPGCPTNPWWFVLTVVLWLAEAINGPFNSAGATAGPLGILDASANIVGGVDHSRRLKAVYGQTVHGPACPRYKAAMAGDFADYPGDSGCLALIGCKGLSTSSLCSLHGWNGAQPHNDPSWDEGIAQVNGKYSGGFCVAAGAPCMGCTEQGYPDAYVPFVAKR